MRQILADYSASISELKKNPSTLIKESHGSAIAVLNHNIPTAYLVPAETYENMIELISDIKLSGIVSERIHDITQSSRIQCTFRNAENGDIQYTCYT